MNEFSGELQQMFKGYGEFHADVDSSPDFMPKLWAKIEARRSPLFAMQRMARLLVLSAMAAALLMVAVLTPLIESRRPAGHYADVVARNDSKVDQEYAATLPLGEAPGK
jgi:hypothetical protein